MTPRRTLPPGTEMTAAQAAVERASDDADAVAESCPYEADLIDHEAWVAVGFYPVGNPAPPF